MLEPTAVTPDGSLVRQIAGGDSEAAQQLYQRHSGSLYALAYGVLMDPVDADTVVEETFIQARQEGRGIRSCEWCSLFMVGANRPRLRLGAR